MGASEQHQADTNEQWDHGSDQRFVDYYAEASLTPATLERFSSVKEKLLKLIRKDGTESRLAVADVGCGVGAQAILWAASGHEVHGLDVNAKLIELGRQRATEQALEIDFRVGSATELPWADSSMDICLLPELLEHVVEWQPCLDEAARILKPGGVLFLSTSNKLCPIQEEFTLPLYSWYPAPLKRHYERLSVTTRPELVNHASYPAVNWFSFYSLRAELRKRGMRAMDRFDLNAMTTVGGKRAASSMIASIAPIRWLAHVATPYTLLVAIKDV